LFPQLRKNILRHAEVKNELENRYKDLRTTLYYETRYTIESDRFRRPQPLYSILNIGEKNNNNLHSYFSTNIFLLRVPWIMRQRELFWSEDLMGRDRLEYIGLD
jgi:hypothetical protein